MQIDLTDKIIQGSAPSPRRPVRLHPIRRAVQVLLGVWIVLAPLENWFRLDLRAADFWVFGHRYSPQHVILFFWSGALLAMTLFAVALIHGRWWCGWVCPQTLASDFGDSVRARLVKLFRAKASASRMKVATGVWTVLMLASAIVTAALLGSYFIAPRIVWSSITTPLLNPGVAFGVCLTATFMAANLIAVRRKFCASVCPYGLFLSIAGDTKTMTVRYLKERGSDCIECGRCVTVCPMSIDIRKGVNQPECIGCGECVDACNDILPRLKPPKAGLIEYRYGEDPEAAMSRLPVAKRLGLWDAKRLLLIAAVVALAAGLVDAALVTHPTTLTVSPSGQVTRAAGNVVETYNVDVQSGYPEDRRLRVSVKAPRGIHMDAPVAAFVAEGKARTSVQLVLSAPASALRAGERIPVTVAALTGQGDDKAASARIIFYVP